MWVPRWGDHFQLKYCSVFQINSIVKWPTNVFNLNGLKYFEQFYDVVGLRGGSNTINSSNDSY